MSRIFLTAALIVALMAAVKDGRIARGTGLTGRCVAVAAPAGQEGDWQRCTAGKLEGAPNLTRQGCDAVANVAGSEYWRCPARLASQPSA